VTSSKPCGFLLRQGAPLNSRRVASQPGKRPHDRPSPIYFDDAPDQKKSGTFFSQLFGWTLKEVDAGKFGIYTLFQKDGQDVAGMMNPTPETPSNESFWHSYIAVENVDECAKRAPSLGGNVVVPPHEVPDVGWVCVVADPTGAVAHLMQPIKQ
jgi:predicted enzyme related to lactoylglutathione lyase